MKNIKIITVLAMITAFASAYAGCYWTLFNQVCVANGTYLGTTVLADCAQYTTGAYADGNWYADQTTSTPVAGQQGYDGIETRSGQCSGWEKVYNNCTLSYEDVLGGGGNGYDASGNPCSSQHEVHTPHDKTSRVRGLCARALQ